MASLVLNNIKKIYEGNVIAVKDFTMDIKDGEFIVFVGPSGCGKSTTLRMIAGLEEISDGELYIDGQLMNDVEPKDRNIAMVFQNYALYPYLTVFDNIAFGLRLRKIPKQVVNKKGETVTKLKKFSKQEIEEKVTLVAKTLGIEDLLKRKPKALSGGQRQRVALARAIVRDATIYLFDEPLSNLDAKLRTAMRVEIIRLHESLKTTFIYVTHDQVEAMTMGDRIVVMKDGVVQQIDKPTSLYDYPSNKFVAGFLGTPQMNFIDVNFLRENDKEYLNFLDTNLLLPKLNYNRYLDDNTKLTMGIRSEHIHIVEHSDFEARVSVIETLGSECILYLKIKDVELTMKVSERVKLLQNQKIFIDFDKENIHLFDKNELEESVIDRKEN